jgi:hypothetical protein
MKTDEYKRDKAKNTYVFIEKIGYGAHRGKGVFIFDDEREKVAKLTYANGKFCGEIPDATVMQHYVADPLLVEGHKFDFNIYLIERSPSD